MFIEFEIGCAVRRKGDDGVAERRRTQRFRLLLADVFVVRMRDKILVAQFSIVFLDCLCNLALPPKARWLR